MLRRPRASACTILTCGLGLLLASSDGAAAAPRSYDGPAAVDAAAQLDAATLDVRTAVPTDDVDGDDAADTQGDDEGDDDEVEGDGVEGDEVEGDPAADGQITASDAATADAEAQDGAEPPVSTDDLAATGDPMAIEVPRSAGRGKVPYRAPKHRVVYRNLLAGRINPLGLVDEITLGYRRRLSSKSTPMFRDAHVMLGAHGFLTPAFLRVGPAIEVQPVGVFSLGASYDYLAAFGTFQQLQSYRSPSASWGPKDLRRGVREGTNYATGGHLVTLTNVLQAKIKRFALRNTLRAYWSHVHLRKGDRVYYDQALDILMPQNGWALTNDTDVMAIFDFGLRVVVRHTLTHAFYRRSDFPPGEPVTQPNGPTSRLGPALAYTFFDRPGARFNRPTILVLAQWWLRHRWRTGTQLSAAVPYAAVGFSFEGDLYPARRRTRRSSESRPRR